MSAADWYRWQGTDLIVQVRVQPRAGRDEFADIQQGRLRVRLNAPPVDGKANTSLCRLLATAFQVPAGQICLLAGATSRDKRLCIHAPRRWPPELPPPVGGPVAGTVATL
jgi:uncharacterized protein (TIGR00251 family)